MDIAPHRTIRIGIFMEVEQPLIIYAVNRFVNIVQRYFVKCFCKVCAAAALTSFNYPCICLLYTSDAADEAKRV